MYGDNSVDIDTLFKPCARGERAQLRPRIMNHNQKVDERSQGHKDLCFYSNRVNRLTRWPEKAEVAAMATPLSDLDQDRLTWNPCMEGRLWS